MLSLAEPMVTNMENKYWIGRKRSAMAMAREATTSEARLIHYELAGRHSIKAAQYAPMMPPPRSTAEAGQRTVLHLRDPGSFERGPAPQPEAHGGAKPRIARKGGA